MIIQITDDQGAVCDTAYIPGESHFGPGWQTVWDKIVEVDGVFGSVHNYLDCVKLERHTRVEVYESDTETAAIEEASQLAGTLEHQRKALGLALRGLGAQLLRLVSPVMDPVCHKLACILGRKRKMRGMRHMTPWTRVRMLREEAVVANSAADAAYNNAIRMGAMPGGPAEDRWLRLSAVADALNAGLVEATRFHAAKNAAKAARQSPAIVDTHFGEATEATQATPDMEVATGQACLLAKAVQAENETSPRSQFGTERSSNDR